MKRLIFDLDGTLTMNNTSDYKSVLPRDNVIHQLRKYKENGFEIVISTARNMRTYEANIGKINIHTLPEILQWLDKHQIPYDEVIVGKPWCGYEGFYIDDRAVRPSEFARLSPQQIEQLINKDKECI
ncbi:HAD-IIIC family phosphatase [Shewanella sp. N2AIL]|uniref:HAD-IIIC family phosphatase n=1 Tax=Shewanella sp. N2AIL TaxID=2926851 RepID=UPI001F59AC06|nr:HAD-IIIC family phosphatase [Shewanella sp. N2AIL]MCI2962148.1 HAD-IIIC family phosphatase [Shewanella sp. N2AIL]